MRRRAAVAAVALSLALFTSHPSFAVAPVVAPFVQTESDGLPGVHTGD